MPPSQSLADALLRHRLPPGSPIEPTHTSMTGGKYYVPGVESDSFVDAYAACKQEGTCAPSIVEQHRHVGPVVVDIDLRQHGAVRMYGRDTVGAFVSSLYAELGKLVELPEEDAECYVLEKPAPRPGKNGAFFKDGLHLVLPGVVTRPELQFALRDAMLPHVAAAFGAFDYMNTPEDIYDAAVIRRNGWLMYGSKKPDEPAPWKLTRVLGPGDAVLWDASADGKAEHASPGELARRLSIRRYDVDEAKLTEHGEQALRKILDAEREVAERREQSRTAEDGVGCVGVLDDGNALALVDMLSTERAGPYQDWLDVGFALHNTCSDSTGLALWYRFGARSTCPDKGDANEHARKWRQFGPPRPSSTGGLGVGSLHFWAKQDSPDAYRTWALSTAKTLASVSTDSANNINNINKQAFVDALKAGVPGYAAMDAGATDIHVVPEGIRFSCAACAIQGLVRKDSYAVEAAEGRVVGYLFREFDINEGVGFVHGNLPTKGAYGCSIRSELEATMQGKPPHHETLIELHNMNTAARFATIKAPEKRAERVDAKGKLEKLFGVLDRGMQQHAASTFGITNNLFVNFGTLNNYDDAPRRADDELSDAWLSVYLGADADERGKFNIVKDGNSYYLFQAHTGLWRHRTAMDASNHMLCAMKSVGAGAFWNNLSIAERKYIGSDRGGKCVFNRTSTAMWDESFCGRLDANLRIVPFSNGAYDLAEGTFRPLRWYDYTTVTIGYDYVPAEAVPEESKAFVSRFFEQVLPVPEERELVLKMLGSAVGGGLANKKFLVLQDYRGGDNGKSMIVKAAEVALGSFCMPNQPAFLSATSHSNPQGHEANTLAYKAKRLAVFDETDPSARFDIAKLKSLTGGAPMMAVRGAGAASVTEFRWSAFILIACNKGCLPQIDSSDAAFLNRMVAVPMRAKFNNAEAASGALYSHPLDVHIANKLADARMAVMHELLTAHRRYIDGGETFGDLPAGCLELRSAITSDSDPHLEAIVNFIEKNITFELSRRPDQKGRRVLGFVGRDDLIERLEGTRVWQKLAKVKTTRLKTLVEAAMAARGHSMSSKTTVADTQHYNVFKDCGWMQEAWLEEA